ncbi:hypothetical protein [Clostridium sp.]|jgi:polyhydroxyalkanoate synthesis regulator phasin|uniref:hypothetical protein n=1 Tax=Clostridium sp. TaxID=1506 RepID=UPI0039F57C00
MNKSKKNNKKNNVLKGIAVGAVLLSMGLSSIAEVTYAVSREVNTPSISEGCCRKREHKNILKESLKELVKEGKLTQEKADNVLSYIKKNKDRREHRGLFDDMVKEGVITKEEAEAIREKNRDKRMLLRREEITKNLNELVKDNTITQEQADKFVEKLQKQDEEIKELHKKAKNMSPEQKKEYMKNALKGKDIIDQMVKEGTITQKQAESMREVMPRPHKEKR